MHLVERVQTRTRITRKVTYKVKKKVKTKKCSLGPWKAFLKKVGPLIKKTAGLLGYHKGKWNMSEIAKTYNELPASMKCNLKSFGIACDTLPQSRTGEVKFVNHEEPTIQELARKAGNEVLTRNKKKAEAETILNEAQAAMAASNPQIVELLQKMLAGEVGVSYVPEAPGRAEILPGQKTHDIPDEAKVLIVMKFELIASVTELKKLIIKRLKTGHLNN